MSNSTKVELFKKPRADFPLYPHRDKKRGTARWAEKVRRTRYYFGNCEGDEDGQKALAEWLRTKDDLLAGRKRRPKDDDSLTVAGLCNHFLTAKDRQLALGELSYRTRADYGAICNRIVGAFGKSRRVEDLTADDFDKLRADVAKIGGPHHVGNVVQRVRTVYKSAFEAGLIDRPVRHGPTFKKPSRGTMRLALPGVHTLRNLRKRLKQVDRLTGRSSERDRDTQRNASGGRRRRKCRFRPAKTPSAARYWSRMTRSGCGITSMNCSGIPSQPSN